MTVIEQILALKLSNQPFNVYLNNGRRLWVASGDFVSTHPSGKGTNLIVYDGENREHFIPVFAVNLVSIE
jgi:hypothetical protein